jgi:hypothetical protein
LDRPHASATSFIDVPTKPLRANKAAACSMMASRWFSYPAARLRGISASSWLFPQSHDCAANQNSFAAFASTWIPLLLQFGTHALAGCGWKYRGLAPMTVALDALLSPVSKKTSKHY